MQRCCASGEYKCIGFDFKMAYPHILSSRLVIANIKRPFHFPTKEGKRFRFKTLKDDLVYGMYRINVHSDDPIFNYVFNFIQIMYGIQVKYKSHERNGDSSLHNLGTMPLVWD
jgi:hypothetical protein